MAVSPPLKWHGGKHYLAKRLVELMPDHVHYVEPYFGGGSVLLAKDPEGVSEVVNDLNGDLMRFWGVLKEPKLFEQFRRRVEATPFAEVEWRAAVVERHDLDEGHPVDRAVAFFVQCRQSMAGRMKSFAPLSRTRTRRGMNEQASAWISAVEGLPAVHERLRRVVILNRRALEVIKTEDTPKTLFYLDPPYLHPTRTAKSVYEYEMSVEDHKDLLRLVMDLRGKVMLSGYPHELYDPLTDWGWTRHDFKIPNHAATGTTKRLMVESVWCNFPPKVTSE